VALHQTRLAEAVNPFNPVFQNTYQGLFDGFARMGHSAAEAKSLAFVEIDRLVVQQASFLGSLDGFYFIIGVALCASVFAVWQKRID
jgi:DHA2 family multidrug resistance protein